MYHDCHWLNALTCSLSNVWMFECLVREVLALIANYKFKYQNCFLGKTTIHFYTHLSKFSLYHFLNKMYNIKWNQFKCRNLWKKKNCHVRPKNWLNYSKKTILIIACCKTSFRKHPDILWCVQNKKVIAKIEREGLKKS